MSVEPVIFSENCFVKLGMKTTAVGYKKNSEIKNVLLEAKILLR